MIYPKSIATLIEQFQKFPSVGPKSAQRMAFQILKMPYSEVEKFANAILNAKRSAKTCDVCFNISTQSPCEICESTSRNRSVICVVAEPKDVMAFERTREYNGLYHVLHGALSPMDGIGPDQLTIRELIARLTDGEVKEILIATNPNIEGETTAVYISKLMKPLGVRVSRLAYGVPVGGDIDYADEVTLFRAIEGRRDL